MRKRYIFAATAIGLIGLLVMSGGVAVAGHKIQDTGSGTVTLDRENGAPEQASGTAKFTLTDETEGFHTVKVTIKVKDLLRKSGNVYEAWLRDNQTDFDHPLKTFQTDDDGDRSTSVTTSVPHFAEYDEVLVTTERKHDENPTRNGTVVLRGKLAH